MPDPRVLLTLADVAWPVDAGKRLRAASMVRALAGRCALEVAVLFADADPQVRPLPPDVPAGRWMVLPPSPVRGRAAAAALVRRGVPWQIAVQDWAPVRRTLGERQGGYDLVWFGALDHFASLRPWVTGRRMIVDCDDVETDKLRRFLALPRGPAAPTRDRLQRRVELPLWGRIQKRAVRDADAVLVCSDLDRERLAEQAAADPAGRERIVSVPNTYADPTDRRPWAPAGACSLVMIANYGTDQNVDAATFAATDVLPLLRERVPGARLRLVGRRPDRLVGWRGVAGLDVVGPVESVAGELAGAHAVLVPIRFGGGTRLKVVEAFAYGVPVVSTTAGAEGIDATDGEQLLLGDSPAALVAAVLRLLDDPQLAGRLGAAGRARYEERYRPEATARAVGALLDRLL